MKINAYGLLELLFVIALAAIGLLLSIHYYSQVKDSQKVTEMQLQLQGIYKAVLQCFTSMSNVNGLTQKNCLSINNLMESGLLSNGYSQNPWGGTYTVQALGSGQRIYLSINANRVPEKSCTVLQGRIGNGNDSVFPQGSFIGLNGNVCYLSIPSVQL